MKTPHEFERVRYERRNPFYELEEAKAGEISPENPQVLREEERVRAFEERTGRGLLERSQEPRLPMTRSDPPGSGTSFEGVAFGFLLGIAGTVATIALRPSILVWVSQKLGFYDSLVSMIASSSEVQGMIQSARTTAKTETLKENGITSFSSDTGTGLNISPSDNTISNYPL